MNGSSSPEKSGINPFLNDIDYLTQELRWVELRSRRIELQRRLLEWDGVAEKGRLQRRQALSLLGSAGQVERALDEEVAVRKEIDARVQVNRTEGPSLGLDRVCTECALNDFDRHLILLGVVPCLGVNAAMESISRVDGIMTSGAIYVELVSLFMELPPQEHFKSLLRLLPGSPLRKHELIRLSYEPSTPSDAVGAGIELSGRVMAAITAMPAFNNFRGMCAAGEVE